MRPSQKTGAEIPKRANPIASRSMSVLRFTAESTPIAMPPISQIVAAPAISQSVRGARWIISVRTET